MENYKKNAINLLVELALCENKRPAVIPYVPAKTEISKKEAPSLQRRIGGKGGKYCAALTDMLRELEDEMRSNVHSIMVLKDGEVILDASAPGYSTACWHLAHSMSKTVTGMALGILYDEGKISLDATAASFFEEIVPKTDEHKKITVHDLLSMRSGVSFAEIGVVTEEKWCEAFFTSKITSEIGKEFSYNSMNSYILGKIITRTVGIPLDEFVRERLFAPLGITNFFWEKSPEGDCKGGFGLYLSAESFAKLGEVILEGGCYFGKRVISEDYISKMCSPVSDAPDSIGGFDYGLHIWVSPDGEELLFNGMLGQTVWIYPKNKIVAAVSAGNNELFSDSPTLFIIRKHLKQLYGIDTPYRADLKQFKYTSEHFFESRRATFPKQAERGLLCFLGIKESRPFDENYSALLGSYATRNNNSSILPIFVSVMQNNYQGGIESFEFKRSGEELIMTSVEGGVSYDIPIGFYGYAESVVNFSGEKYKILAMTERLLDEDRKPIYKIELIFPELPNTRILKVTHTEEGILVRMSETPNEKIAEKFFESMNSTGKSSFVTSLIEKKMGDGFIKNKTEALFNPTLRAISTKNPRFREILAADNAAAADANEKSSKLIKTLISGFAHDEKKSADGEGGGISSFFKNALSLLLRVAKVKPDDAQKSEVIEIPDDAIVFLDSDASSQEDSE